MLVLGNNNGVENEAADRIPDRFGLQNENGPSLPEGAIPCGPLFFRESAYATGSLAACQNVPGPPAAAASSMVRQKKHSGRSI